jgi:nicotinamidase-related amidase
VVAGLLTQFRAQGWPVAHVMHDDRRPASAFRRGLPGFVVMDCAAPVAGEPVFVKTTSAAFASTDLAGWARERGVARFVVVGASVNHCVSSTVRAGFDAGFRLAVVRDGVFGFAVARHGGGEIDPDTVRDVVLGSLAPVLADVIDSDQVAGWVG